MFSFHVTKSYLVYVKNLKLVDKFLHIHKKELKRKDSVAGTRTRVSRVRAEYPNHLDYNGIMNVKILYKYLTKIKLSEGLPLLLLFFSYREILIKVNDRMIFLFAFITYFTIKLFALFGKVC